MTDASPVPSSPDTLPPAVTPVRAAVSGVVAALVALALGELLAGLVTTFASPVSSVGSALIDLAPPGSKEVVVSLFGTGDKLAIAGLVILAVVAVGAGAGILGRRSFGAATGVILALAAIGGIAALRAPGATPVSAMLPAAIDAIAGTWALSLLLAAARLPGHASAARTPGSVTARGATTPADAARRGFLLRAGVLGGLAILGGGVGRRLLDGRATQAAGAAAVIPQATDPAPSLAPDAGLAVAGITPLVMPNDRFYRIDTALVTPAVDVATWSLRVHGMVDREVTLRFADIVELPLIERYVTIACVSNEVGGDLVGNAKWTGVRLTDVLDMAGVQAGATQVVPRSVDGWTAGFPTAWLHDPAHPRDAMIAVKMNDVPLPAEHGFPARLIVPGLYGYVSATKWLSELELTTLEAFDAYWVPRGWAKQAPILTQSRIDVPRDGASVPAGAVTIAGVAWAPDRGIARVEVSVDSGPWQAATIGDVLSKATWVQWRLPWQAAAGTHLIEVRATDGTGDLQTDQVTRPDPDGARGHHRVQVTVT